MFYRVGRKKLEHFASSLLPYMMT